MSDSISPMGVGGVQHLVERAYRESDPMQFVRELFKNAIEADATRIEFGPEWQGVAASNVYRLMVADNGAGMGPEKIEAYLNTFGGGGKPIGDAHENFGVGSKTSTLPWNRLGVVVLSWTEECPDGSMVWLCRDPATGEYGARKFETDDGEFVNVVVPFDDEKVGIDWSSIRPEWIRGHGTVVVLLGNHGTEDTFVEKVSGEEPFGGKGISAYLNRRVWKIPTGVEVYVQELRSNKRADWPRSLKEAAAGKPPAKGKVDRRWNHRRLQGAKHYVRYKKTAKGGEKATGSVALSDGTVIEWYLWQGERPAVHSYAHDKGYIAARYDDELYDLKKHHSSFRRFGITSSDVRERLTLIACPPRSGEGEFGVYPDTARTSLRVMGSKRAGEPLPWDEWGDEFAHRLPEQIVDAIKAARSRSEGSLDDEKWKERLAERFGARWKRPIFRKDPGGQATVSPDEAGRNSGQTGRRRKPSKKPRPAGGRSRNPESSGGSSGASPGPKPARAAQAAGGVPTYRWVSGEDVEPGVAAVFVPPSAVATSGEVLLSEDFAPFSEVIRYWQQQYPDHLADEVGQTVRDVYGQSMVARVAHSQALARDPNWGQKKVSTELRSPAALTMAALGLVNEDHVISSRLGSILGVKRNLR